MSTSARYSLALQSLALCVAVLLVPASWAQGGVVVAVTGLTGEPLANVQAALGIARLSPDDARREAKVRRQHEAASDEIRRALQPFGYYRPTIAASLETGDTDWRAQYDVNPGDRVPIGRSDIRLRGAGAEDAELIAVRDALPLLQAAALDHREYEASKQTLSSAATRLGYLDARFVEHRVEVDLEAYRASVTLLLDTGPRYRVGTITFGESDFSEGYLARYLVLQPGSTFTHEALATQRATLSRSGHFQEVSISTREPEDKANPAIPLDIRVVPFKPNRYRGRIGWGTDTDFGLQLDWTRRYLGSHGHQFTAGFTAVQDRDRLAGDLSYLIPLQPLDGSRIELRARHESKDLTFKEVDLDEGGETRIATNLAGVSWHLANRRLAGFNLETSLSLGLVAEDYDVFEVLFGNLPDSAQDVIRESIGEEAYNTLSPDFEAVTAGLRLALKRSDDALYIRRGDSLTLDLLGADENLGSNISFWQARLATWTIRPLGDRHRLLARTALGYSDADSREALGVTFNQIPEFYEFRAGGARSVRGYGFETIFPVDGITGGKHQLVASLEYEHEIIPDWSAAVFLDAGDAFNDFDDFDEKLGTGFGVRWRSPVGLARIDFGFPLDDADDSFQIYITVGPEF